MPRRPKPMSPKEVRDAADRAEKRPVGRPTDFAPSMGEEILALMSEGLSLAAAAAEVGVHRQRVYEWLGKHPEFADTVRLAQVKRQAFLERRLLSAKEGPVVTSSIFALKNAGPEDWRDRVVNEHSGPGGGPIQTQSTLDLAALSDEELAAYRIVAAAARRDREGD